jgi:hypothetical protein
MSAGKSSRKPYWQAFGSSVFHVELLRVSLSTRVRQQLRAAGGNAGEGAVFAYRNRMNAAEKQVLRWNEINPSARSVGNYSSPGGDL